MTTESAPQRARRLAKGWIATLDHQGNAAWRSWLRHVYVKGYMTALEDATKGENA